MLKGKNILVADDNKLNQKILIFILEKTGAIVKIANNGKEAIEQMTNNPIDAVLMDIQMPEMDGLEATVHIRKVMNSNVPIIGLTANTLEGEKLKCVNAGMNTCVSKPFEPAELCKLILQLTEN